MITKFFTPAKEEEILIESLNTPTELNNFMESFITMSKLKPPAKS